MKNLSQTTENPDKRTELILGNLLRIGVISAGTIVLIGAVLFFIRHGNEIPNYHNFKFDSLNVNDPSELFNELFALKSIAIMKLGILILIATPVLRVIVSVIAFLYEKDYMYVMFTLIVLAVLLYSLFF